MTHQNDYSLPVSITTTLIEQGWEAIPEMIKVIVDQAMQEERKRYLQAVNYERIENRQGSANGYKPGWDPSHSRYQMYVQGVSTRKVKEITEQLCSVEISAEQVSRATALLDTVLQEWRERSLGEVQYLYLDARYEKVRESGRIRDAAVLVATGITLTGERQVLGVDVSLSEHETHSPRGCFAMESLLAVSEGSWNDRYETGDQR